MEPTSSTTGAMSFQPPLPISTGTTTSSARPSLAGIGPTTLPPTWSRPGKRSASGGGPAWAAGGAGADDVPAHVVQPGEALGAAGRPGLVGAGYGTRELVDHHRREDVARRE